MSLAQQMQAQAETVHGYPCSVANLISEAEARGELADLQVILYGRAGLTEPKSPHRGWTEKQVYAAVTAEGYEVAQSQINEHRGKRCRCYRNAR